MRVLWTSSKVKPASYEIRDMDIPTPGADEVLIKNVAVASNPKDWKMAHFYADTEGIEGNDVAGYVEAVGANVTEFSKGDRVAAMTEARMLGGTWGAYAEYSIAPANTTFKSTKTPFEEASTLPLAVMTAHLGLFVRIGLTTPPEDGSIAPSNGQIVVVNGASSSVGMYAVQLAKHAGYAVVGTAGSSADVATAAGADIVVDYRGKDDAQLEQALKDAVGKLGGKMAGGLDCVGTDSGTLITGKVAAAYGASKISHVLPNKAEKDPSYLPQGVTTKNTAVFNSHSEDKDFAGKWYKLIGQWVDAGKFQPNKVKVIPGGLGGVEEGLALLENNKVNAVKLVYRIEETK